MAGEAAGVAEAQPVQHRPHHVPLVLPDLRRRTGVPAHVRTVPGNGATDENFPVESDKVIGNSSLQITSTSSLRIELWSDLRTTN